VNIEPSLKYLLSRPDPFICLIKGQWGVGKTFFIRKFVREHRAEIAKTNFSYVSLFGIASIDELVQAIFVNSVSTKTLDTKTLDTTLSDTISSDEALSTRAKYLLDRAKPLLARAGGLPIFGVNAMRGFTLGTMAHFFNRNSLIVIDDLERHSATLPVRDILGVITQLKEERGCQIIIVMNEDALKKDDGDAPYFETKEKVIDRELTFEPTVDEAIAIGLSDYQRKNQFAAEHCRKLKIANIRTIQKIDSALRQLRDVLSGLNLTAPEPFDQQLQSSGVLAVWTYWERIIDIDDLEKLEPGDSTVALMEEALPRLSDKQKDLYQRVRDYGYAYSDDTDKMIIRFIKSGVIDSDEMRLRVQENDAALENRRKNEAIERAWEVYRTLKVNPDEVVTALYEAHVAGIEEAQTAMVAPAVWVMRELGHEDKADDLTDKFFKRAAPIGSYSSYPFHEMIADSKFVERWKTETEKEVSDERDLDTTITSFYSEKTSIMDDIKRLAQFTADDFYEWFSSTDNPRVFTIAKALSRIEYRLPLVITETEKVEADVMAALRRIADESKINQIRLRSLFPREL
jgi:GTPase SAR1 family protein